MKYQTLLDGGGWIRWCGKRGGKKEERREDTGKALEGKEPGWILEGGKRRGPEPSRTGININLNIGTEYRVQIADALGKEPKNHPKMSKLWDSETGPNTHTILQGFFHRIFTRWCTANMTPNKKKISIKGAVLLLMVSFVNPSGPIWKKPNTSSKEILWVVAQFFRNWIIAWLETVSLWAHIKIFSTSSSTWSSLFLHIQIWSKLRVLP